MQLRVFPSSKPSTFLLFDFELSVVVKLAS